MGFANPAGLLFSIFIAALIFLYFWERSRQRYDVPSLLFWEAVPEAVVQRRRFQPDALFWLQLAALAALILAVANPYRVESSADDVSQRMLLVFDLSASMQAREADTDRFGMARAEALRVIAGAPPQTRFAVIGAGRHTFVEDEFDDDRDAVARFIGAMEPFDVAARIEPALMLARQMGARSDTATEVHVFTDLDRSSVDERLREGMHWWPFGRADDNLAIVALEPSHPILTPGKRADVHVTVRNFGNRERHGSLTLSIDGRSAGVELFTAPPGTELGFLFAGITGTGVVEARLNDDDALWVDNRRYGWIPPARERRITVSSPDPAMFGALTRIGAAAGFSVVTEADAPSGDVSDINVWHRSVPNRMPDGPTLLIAPEVEIESLQPLDTFDDAEVVDWRPEHPALRDLDLGGLPRFGGIRAGRPPAWGDVVVTGLSGGREIPLVVAGRFGDYPVAIVAADLAASGILATDQEPTLLLLLNLFEWLIGAAEQSPITETGQTIDLSGGEPSPIDIVDPRGRRFAVSAEGAAALDLDRAGRYAIERDGRESGWLLANFASAAESDIGRVPTAPFRAEAQRQSTRHATSGSGGARNLLYVVACCLLIAEWMRATRTYSDG